MRHLAATSLILVLALTACRSAGSGRAYGGGWAGPYGSYGPTASAAPLTGGETDDNVRLPEYLAYVDSYPHGDVPKLDLTDRRIVTLLGADGLPLWDHPVEVSGTSFRARTNAAGQFLLPYAALGLSPQSSVTLNASVGDALRLAPGMSEVRVPRIVRQPPPQVPVDVALVVDTTGSMGDEVERLRTTLRSVVAQLNDHVLRPSVRVGGVAYRDVGDEYLVRPFDFTSDLSQVQHTLDTMRADGGGDGPEAVQEALETAVHRLSWRGTGTVRILFLIGDAPPHFERGTPYTQTMRDAVERGITIVPVACSGMDDTGEFVWRQLAAVTLGSFLFVSYGGGTDHHTGAYEENDLDSLMLRAVGRSLDALANAGGNQQGTAVASGHPGPVPAGTPPPPLPGSRTGYGRSPWEFGIPGWSR